MAVMIMVLASKVVARQKLSFCRLRGWVVHTSHLMWQAVGVTQPKIKMLQAKGCERLSIKAFGVIITCTSTTSCCFNLLSKLPTRLFTSHLVLSHALPGQMPAALLYPYHDRQATSS